MKSQTSKTFDPESHIYRIADVQVPSITQVLPEQNYYMSEADLEIRKQQGSESHEMIKLYRDTGETFNDPELIAFKEWEEENKDLLGKLVMYEQPLYSTRHMYAGTPDSVYELALVEKKRTLGDKRHKALQLAGQSVLVVENKIIHKTKKWYVAWFENGKIKHKNVYNEHAEDAFIGLVKRHYINQNLENYFKGAW